MHFVGQTASRVDKMSGLATALLLSCVLLLLIVPNGVSMLTGKRTVAPLAPPDELSRSAGEDPTPFLIRRNVVELTVPEEMTVRELLEVYRLNKPDQTRQVLEQLGNKTTPDTKVKLGTRLKIALTPMAKDVPGAPSRKARP